MTTQESFMRAILADPNSDGVRLAYADWLDDDYADFIRVQCALAAPREDDPDDFTEGAMTTANLRRAESALFRQGKIDWWKLVPWVPPHWTMTHNIHMTAFRVGPDERREREDVRVWPRRGFAEHIKCTCETFEEFGERIVATTPLKLVSLWASPGMELADFRGRFPGVVFKVEPHWPSWNQAAWINDYRPYVSLSDAILALPDLEVSRYLHYILELPNLGPAVRGGFVLQPSEWARHMPLDAHRWVSTYDLTEQAFAAERDRERLLVELRDRAACQLFRHMDASFLEQPGRPRTRGDYDINVVALQNSDRFIREGVHRDLALRSIRVTLDATGWYSHRATPSGGRRLTFSLAGQTPVRPAARSAPAPLPPGATASGAPPSG